MGGLVVLVEGERFHYLVNIDFVSPPGQLFVSYFNHTPFTDEETCQKPSSCASFDSRLSSHSPFWGPPLSRQSAAPFEFNLSAGTIPCC